MHIRYKETKNTIKIREKKSKHIEPHLHSALEIVYVTEGTLELGMGTELFHMERGDLGLIFPDVIHHYQVFCPGVNRACYIQILPASTNVFYEKLQKDAPEYPIIKEKNMSEELKNIIAVIMNTSETEQMIVEAYIQIILARCLPTLKLIDKQSVGSTDVVYQVVAYVSSHFRERVTLDKMATDLGISKYVLSRAFSKTFHRNFSQYLNDARINYAVSAIENTNDTLLDIAMESGFDSQRTFNRVFKDRFHMSPSEYRKMNIQF